MTLDETFLPIGASAPEAAADAVRVGAFEPRSVVAGPGQRAVLWVAGCLRRCPGCMKPDLFDFNAGRAVDVAEIEAWITAVPDLDGVTFSGGEPFEQAAPLAKLARRIRGRRMTVLVYSGYRLEALRAHPERFGSLLDETDILIDGEYRRDLPGPFRWRGSSNQLVHLLREQADVTPPAERPVREMQVSMTAGGVRLSGFPSPAVETSLAERLRTRGVYLKPAK
jgi:anaerobic ribonucleoside-triphosphate reductase activating protein